MPKLGIIRRMTFLAIDVGNTRLKWAWLAEGPARHTVHASPHHDLTALEQTCRITPPRRAASMLAASNVSTPSSPTRFLQRVRLEGSMGNSVCR